jgi:hypothetical protein
MVSNTRKTEIIRLKKARKKGKKKAKRIRTKSKKELFGA